MAKQCNVVRRTSSSTCIYNSFALFYKSDQIHKRRRSLTVLPKISDLAVRRTQQLSGYTPSPITTKQELIRSFSKQHGSFQLFSPLPSVKLVRVWQRISTHRHVITSVPPSRRVHAPRCPVNHQKKLGRAKRQRKPRQSSSARSWSFSKPSRIF